MPVASALDLGAETAGGRQTPRPPHADGPQEGIPRGRHRRLVGGNALLNNIIARPTHADGDSDPIMDEA
ncbi:hypothetical protein ACWC5I_24705, partial [Kitasatospora sp. NPDC001574]